MMKSLLRVAGVIALLLAVYFLLQVLSLNVSITVAALMNGFPLENLASYLLLEQQEEEKQSTKIAFKIPPNNFCL